MTRITQCMGAGMSGTQHTAGALRVTDGRLNDGDHILIGGPLDDGVCIAAVDFQTTAKRGQAWNTKDPEGRANADRLALCWNAHDGLVAALEWVADLDEDIVAQLDIASVRNLLRMNAAKARAALAKAVQS